MTDFRLQTWRLRWLYITLAVGLIFARDVIGPYAAHAVSISRTTVTTTVEELTKGIGFPIIGLREQQVPVFLSVRIFSWTQSDDDPLVLTPSDDITTFPQLLRVDSNQTQNVRIQMVKPIDDSEERYYRIVLDEFDRIDKPNQTEAVNMVVRNKPRVTVPIIVRSAAASKVPGSLEVSAIKAGASNSASTDIRIANTGRTFAVVRSVTVAGKQYDKVAVILPGKSQSIAFPAKIASQDEITVAYEVSVDGRPAKRESPRYVAP